MGISKYEYDLRKKISKDCMMILEKNEMFNKKEMANEVKLLDDIYNNDLSLQKYNINFLKQLKTEFLVNEMCGSFKKTTVNVFSRFN